MSLISNRKRPRGFSGSFDQSNNQQVSSIEDPLYSNPINAKLNSNTANELKFYSETVFEDSENEDIRELNEPTDDNDDDIIILEERNLTDYRIKPKRNNSDSIIFFDSDSFNALKLLNVNNNDMNNGNYTSNSLDLSKKQRTNSLPQLPQVKCIYEKSINSRDLNVKLGNVKTNLVPYNLKSPPCDDKDGHFIVEINSIFANRFIILQLLGQGTFGKVVKCYDKLNHQYVAIKIIRNIPKYRDAAKIELRVLATLKKLDDKNLNHCLHLRECFDYRGHICIVTDLLKISLYDYLERNKFIPFPGSQIQAVSKQLIRSVTFLHDLKLIHTDLKPENILLYDDSFVNKPLSSKTLISSYMKLSNIKDARKLPKTSKILKDTSIQIIDFGSAIFNDEYHSSIVSTRHYRAPEIVLGCGWSYPCDMWSVGCILVELIIGEPLFKTHNNLEHLAMIEKFVGYRIDKCMVRTSKMNGNECGVQYFSDLDNLDHGLLNDNDEDEDEEDDDDENDEEGYDDELRLIFPDSNTPKEYITNVNQLSRIDDFISKRIGLKINFDYSLNYNYDMNKHLISFGNFTFWWFLIDLLKNLFIINPYNRLTATEAMEHPWFNLGIEDEGTI